MSGIGEALAIVSCVAGLIQALDSGSRIVKQIKDRRQAHRANGALPPSIILEQTLEDGRQQIEQIVAKGNARFGNDFEAGDDTAELALSRITIQIQNALLARLTLARSDDGVVDFEECIDLSDKGCTDALVALQALYQRKLQEDMDRKNKARQSEQDLKVEPAQKVKKEELAPLSRPELTQSVSAPVNPVLPLERLPAPLANERKKLRGISGMFHSKPKQEQTQQQPTPAPSTLRRDTAPAASTNLHRISTASSQASSIPERSKGAHRLSISSQQSGLCLAKSSTDEVAETQHTWSSSMSRASTLASIGTNAAISNYGACCKYSHLIRENGARAGLGMINTAMYSVNWVYQCKSVKCSFGKAAVKTKKGWEIDDRIYVTNGVQYRWLFLAKSHVQIPNDSAIKLKPYKCLICLLLHHNSETYLGIEELFSHILEHREKQIGDTVLEGPLSFCNQGATVDPYFDVNLPKFGTPHEKPQPTHGTRRVVVEVQQKLEGFAMDRGSKSSSVTSYSTDTNSSAVTDPLFNPWVLH